MKYHILLYCVAAATSCSPKYTASFKDYSRRPTYHQSTITTQPSQILPATLDTCTQLPEEVSATTKRKPAEFKRARIYTQPDSVTARQDTILLKNGDTIVGKIMAVTSGKLVCRVSEWKTAGSSYSYNERKGTDQVIALSAVFLIKYGNGTNESGNFSKKSEPGPSSKGNPKRNVFAIIGLILALLSLYPLSGIIFAPIAILFSIIGLKSQKRKLARLGLIYGCVGLLLGVFWWILYVTSWS